MKIIDLDKRYEPLYCNCLIGDPERLKDAGDYKRRWYETMKPRGLKVKLALDDAGEPVGMVQYAPVAESPVTGKDMYYLYCIWVINDKRFRGNHQKMGFGTALLDAFEEDARQSGRKGVIVWGLSLPVFMPARWFKKHGYQEVARQGMQVLLWKAWGQDVTPPSWIRPHKLPAPTPGKSTVTCFCGGWCLEVNQSFSRTKRVIAEVGRDFDFQEIDTTDRKTFDEYGLSDALFIDGKEMPLGPAPSYAKIKRAIQKSVKKAEKRKR